MHTPLHYFVLIAAITWALPAAPQIILSEDFESVDSEVQRPIFFDGQDQATQKPSDWHPGVDFETSYLGGKRISGEFTGEAGVLSVSGPDGEGTMAHRVEFDATGYEGAWWLGTKFNKIQLPATDPESIRISFDYAVSQGVEFQPRIEIGKGGNLRAGVLLIGPGIDKWKRFEGSLLDFKFGNAQDIQIIHDLVRTSPQECSFVLVNLGDKRSGSAGTVLIDSFVIEAVTAEPR